MDKSEFFGLFQKAWVTTFTVPLVLKSFSATGIHPPNADFILGKFTHRKPSTPEAQTIPKSNNAELSWLKAKSLLHSLARDKGSVEVQMLEGILST